MVTFIDKFQYRVANQSIGEQKMKELDNEGVQYLFDKAKRVVSSISCEYDVTVTFRGNSTRNVFADIDGHDTDVTKIYKALEWWFRKNAMGREND